MAKIIRTYHAGDTPLLGTIVTDKLGAQVNPTNGVTVTVKDAAGAEKATDQVCTQAQWDEDNSDPTGQYYFSYQTVVGNSGIWSAEFTIDPGGALEGFDIVQFIVE